MSKAIGASALVATIVLVALFWIPGPMKQAPPVPQMRDFSRDKGIEAPAAPLTTTVKSELKDWLDILGKLSPLVTAGIAIWSAKRKRA
jgi:hypothetical protein